MFWKKNKDPGDLEKKQSTFSKILDDLTTLEINTIIKKGMTAVAPPERVEETVQGLLVRYKTRMDRIIYNNSEDFPELDSFNFENDWTYKQFHEQLIKFKEKLDEIGKGGRRLTEEDYTRIIRMLGFCDFIRSASGVSKDSENQQVKKKPEISLWGEFKDQTLYEVNLEQINDLRINTDTRNQVKINRYYDLGDETVVMQTRFGIDGDIVTRIEEDFSNRPKELITKIHDEHTNLSVNYWKSLIDIAKGIIFRD